MDANQVRKVVVQVAHILGLAFAAVAVVKFAGVGTSLAIPGTVESLALLACACSLAR